MRLTSNRGHPSSPSHRRSDAANGRLYTAPTVKPFLLFTIVCIFIEKLTRAVSRAFSSGSPRFKLMLSKEIFCTCAANIFLCDSSVTSSQSKIKINVKLFHVKKKNEGSICDA